MKTSSRVTMKAEAVLFLVVALSAAVVNSAPQKSDVSSPKVTMGQLFSNWIAAFQHIMPCGDSSTNIPVLSPFRLPIVSLDINHELLVLNGSIRDLVITGLEDIVVIELKTNPTSQRTSFDILLKDVQVLGEYDLYANLDLAGYKTIINLNGLMNVQVKDIRWYGGVNFGVNTDKGTTISDLYIDVAIGDIISYILDTQWTVALNDYINKQIRDTALMWIQVNRELISETLSNVIVKQADANLFNVTMSQYMQYMTYDIQEWNSISCATNN